MKDGVTGLHTALGYKPLTRLWAKLEIVIGLAAVGIGVLLGQWAISRPISGNGWALTGASLALFVLGGYLALAGHRSHLYQSNNELTAYLANLIRDARRQPG